MGSVLLWETDLGLTTVGSGELSPGRSGFELRFKPPYGFGRDEWRFEIGVTKGKDIIEHFRLDYYNFDTDFFILKLFFFESSESSEIQIYATHLKTDFKMIIWEGEILPSKFDLTKDIHGLISNWNVIDDIKEMYPNINFGYSKVPTINVTVSERTIIASVAKAEDEHNPENAPLVFKDFHPNQDFNVLIKGHVLGYGGKGGDAGMSTVTDEIDIIYPTDACDGGNVIFVEHETQEVNILVEAKATFQVGQGGSGASSFMINCPEKRFNQLGNAGLGGYPTGLCGKYTDIHFRVGVVKKITHAAILSDNKGKYTFQESEITSQTLPVFPVNVTIPKTKNGNPGVLKPKGVSSLRFEGGSSELKELTFVSGRFVVTNKE